MEKYGAVFLILLLSIPLASSISIRDLIARYSFSAAAIQMNVTNSADFMVDRNNNGVNDTLVFELTANNAAGPFIFAVDLYDRSGVLSNSVSRTLSAGTSKLNITFDSFLLEQAQFNYSIKVYSSNYSLRYRKDNIQTKKYQNYEEGFRILGIKDSRIGKMLAINVTLNSSVNGTFETMLFLSYNNSIVYVKENKTLSSSAQLLLYYFGNETVKRTKYAGNFKVASLKIGGKAVKSNFTTLFYDFSDFADSSYIVGFADSGADSNSNKKYDVLQINATVQIIKGGNYTIAAAFYDLLGNLVEIKNVSSYLNNGRNTMTIEINGTGIYGKKLNGPFIIESAWLFDGSALADYVNDAYTTSGYNFGDFESPDLPDLRAEISVSGGYHYGISNITVNFTFENTGNKPAFNVFTEIFDNLSMRKSNKSGVLAANSKISYQINLTNISDFEAAAIADLQDFVEEKDESNNAKRVAIKLNKRPNLDRVKDITANETDKLVINLSASDPNSDNLSFSVNLSKFSSNSNIFEWSTSTTDSGNYTLSAAVSDGFLNDSVLFNIAVLDAPEKDFDNDGINDSIDTLIGNENSVNTSTISLTILLGSSRNLSRQINESVKISFMDGNLAIAEFDFNFSRHKLNLANLTINKQAANATGSLFVKGLELPEGTTKTLYMDKVNATINGICVKDMEISSIAEISGSCSSADEFKIECDGTLQNSYSCSYNLTIGKYRINGLRHSGITQIDYAKPASGQSGSSASGNNLGGTSGGGGGITCISNWKCSEWSQCVLGYKKRKCIDASQCAFGSSRPAEQEKCAAAEESLVNAAESPIPENNMADKSKGNKAKENTNSKKLDDVTGMSIRLMPQAMGFPDIFDIFAVVLALAASYLAIMSLLLDSYKK